MLMTSNALNYHHHLYFWAIAKEGSLRRAVNCCMYRKRISARSLSTSPLTATERDQLRRRKNRDEGLVRIDCYVPDEVLKAVQDRYPDTVDKLVTRGLKLLLSAKES